MHTVTARRHDINHKKGTFKCGTFSRMEDSPSKLSVAELAGRFKGHILPMPTAHDESPFRRKPPCSLRFPVREGDVQGSDTNTVSTSPIQIRMKSSNIIERLQANLALSPTTLLPSPKGAELNRQPDSPPPPLAAVGTTVSPLSPDLQPAQLSVEEQEQEEPVSFNSTPEGATLPSFHKTRVRLSFKRRPPSRQHRRSAGEEASLFRSPSELRSPEANGDALLQCADRVTLEEGEDDKGEPRDSEEEQGARAKAPPEDEEETRAEEVRRTHQMDGLMGEL
ncbi:capZ-interacting protein isoform X2 [Phyllopteryx taeniolatus]|uniref:capZ-interacting protein isoform X2 n=1 Tax=Phyllopteryx taeniolatus TaxID=161469 RepID=UPI002AD1FC4E|nr:capZ-interacting protein isoform X2 [Phyllopteryx taeniolatus]